MTYTEEMTMMGSIEPTKSADFNRLTGTSVFVDVSPLFSTEKVDNLTKRTSYGPGN